MDILTRILEAVRNHMGADTFTEDIAITIETSIRAEYGGDDHYLASLRASETQRRHALVKKLADSGMSNPEIAERLGMTRQGVWVILRK